MPVDLITARRGRLAVALRTVLCVLTLTPLLRWAVVTHAVRPGRPWRRVCPRCRTRLGPAGDLAALAPTARCGRCRQRLGPPPWMLEVVILVSAAALLAAGLRGLPLAAYFWWTAVGVVLLFVDLAVGRLPARLSYAAAGGLLAVLALDAALGSGWGPWVRAVSGALLAAAALGMCALAAPRLVYWGDFRYALALGAAAAWVGWLALYAAAFLGTLFMALLGVGLIVAGRASLRSHLPAGPFLYAGALLAVVLLICRFP